MPNEVENIEQPEEPKPIKPRMHPIRDAPLTEAQVGYIAEGRKKYEAQERQLNLGHYRQCTEHAGKLIRRISLCRYSAILVIVLSFTALLAAILLVTNNQIPPGLGAGGASAGGAAATIWLLRIARRDELLLREVNDIIEGIRGSEEIRASIADIGNTDLQDELRAEYVRGRQQIEQDIAKARQAERSKTSQWWFKQQ
ncbi:hypothetical protein ACWDA3_29590 [Nonomuraea rubra]